MASWTSVGCIRRARFQLSMERKERARVTDDHDHDHNKQYLKPLELAVYSSNNNEWFDSRAKLSAMVNKVLFWSGFGIYSRSCSGSLNLY